MTAAAGPPPLLVDTPTALGELLASVAGPGDLPLDTEADSFHHYFEKICLVQLAVERRAVLVDPLALDIGPLLSALGGRRLLMHGADYDLRLLHRGHAFRAGLLFDTMPAAQLLGEPAVGLAALLEKYLGVKLDKAHQRADWSARPLAPELVAYAAEDVVHLPELVAVFTERLAAAGRLAWHEEECARLTVGTFDAAPDDPENDWRLKGANALSSRERAFLRSLWRAREERARELDRPPFRVLTNERLLAGVKTAAAGEERLEVLFPGPRPLPPAFARSVARALAEARALAAADWPLPRRGERVEADPQLERAVEALKKRRDALAKALALDPGVLASRATLTAAARVRIAAGGPLPGAELAERTGMSRWRAELLAG